MSSFTFPLPAGVLSQPRLSVFPAGVAAAPPAPGIVQLATQECTAFWQTVFSGVGAGVEGAWKVFVDFPGTANDNKWFSIIINADSFPTTDRFAEFDIGAGGAGSEVPVIDDLGYSINGKGVSGGKSLGVPYTGAFDGGLPSGSRISVRIKDNVAASIVYRIHLQFWGE